MAGRNPKNRADWFSHDADASSDEKVVYLESIFGHMGYAVYFKFLECMARSEDFRLKWDVVKKAIYAAKFSISVTEIDRFITECCREEIKAFIVADGYIFSPGLLKRLTPLLTKREYNRQKYHEQKQADIIPVTEKPISATKKTQSKVKESKVNTYSDEFLMFWKKYPRKVAKGDAWKAWAKQNGNRPPLEQLIPTIERQCQTEQWQKDNGQFIPHPATWLNQCRWDDEAEIKIPEPKKEYTEWTTNG